MGLYTKWQELMDSQTDETFEDFWKEYSDTETKIYTHILENHTESFQGKVSDLVEKFQADPVIFTGFLDGIQTSLKSGALDLEKVSEEDEICFSLDFEKLFFNMLVADAQYLYTLPQWENVLTMEKMEEIIKAYKKSKTVVKSEKIGRNHPCPCGSGKKYKKCCGA